MTMTNPLTKDLLFLVLQFLDEEKFKETLHILEQESGLFFNMKHFEGLILDGKWDEVELYLSGFIKLEDNSQSMKTYFEIRKQKYFEALDKQDRNKAVEILNKDLKFFSSFNEDLYKEITQLITLDNIRENLQLAAYKDVKTARTVMLVEVKRLIESNPLLHNKLQFPNVRSSRLRTLVNQSCRISRDQHGRRATSSQSTASRQRTGASVPMGATGPASTSFQSLLSMMAPTPSSSNQLSLGGPSNPAAASRGVTESDTSRGQMLPPGMNPSQNGLQSSVFEELPNTVARTLNQGALTTSMDFHPIQQTLLLAGTNLGEVTLWEVSTSEKLVSRNFQVWDIGACSKPFKTALTKDPRITVRRVSWSPDGSFFGVAYSKHMLQLYTFMGGSEFRQHLEIDAHIGAVNDISFCSPSNNLSIITCGDDKIIKVWDVLTGTKLHTFKGHEAAVHCVCPHQRDGVHFLFSTSVDGKIKAWLFDAMGSRVDYFTPGHSCATMAYSVDGKRLFSCGTTREGGSHLVEWNENEGTLKRTYRGFNKRSFGVVQFDTAKNRFLAVGDDYSIKFWDMDNSLVLMTINAEGGLPVSPRIRFNKEGSLLAVATSDNRIKILATIDGLRLMRTNETRYYIVPRPPASEAPTQNGDSRRPEDPRPKPNGEVGKVTEISTPTQFRSLKLSANIDSDKLQIGRLSYTNSGSGILALPYKAIHLLWKWPTGDLNPNGKATTKVTAKLVRQASGVFMTNHVPEGDPVQTVPCFALSKNDNYLMSASGGNTSLFNMVTFKRLDTVMYSPPVATYVAFDPQDNNIVAIGMEDSAIYIHNVRLDEIKCKLHGHSKRITGLAFSHVLNILVSSGADAQIIVWDASKWVKKNSFFLQPPTASDTQIQFKQDETQLLVVNETQLAIYDIRNMECIKQLSMGEASISITQATFSCDSQLVYGGFVNGTVRIYNASNLQLQRQINPSAYLPSDVRSSVYPLAVAAHPQEPNQFAVGLTDGSVYVFEPLECEGKWDVLPQHQRIDKALVDAICAQVIASGQLKLQTQPRG